jgi:hypothetical protein
VIIVGREIKRVPLGFEWPLNKVWEGYLSPDRLTESPCPAGCHNGSTAAGAWLESLTYLLLMLPGEVPQWKNTRTDSARTGRLHPWLESMEHRPGVPPSADIAELTGALAGRAPRHPFGHDALDHWAAVKAIVKGAGLDPDVWGICPACKGHATVEAYEGQRAESEAWESTEPPAGDGWQLWETVSEGSPISPVFATPEELAGWMSQPERERNRVSRETALKFIGEGWAPTFMSSAATGLVTGVEFVGREQA